ncbi:hypothetical protein CPB84DRAFT_1777417, partial [Gymnopilus junonius]
MVFQHISANIKKWALWLLQHEYIPEDVAYILGVSPQSLLTTCLHFLIRLKDVNKQ